MKRFFADHSYDMVKLMLNQIAISIFGFSLALAAGRASSEILRNATSVLSILFYLFLTYITAWDIGYRDKVSVDLGKKRSMPYKGALISLCANSVNLILALLILLGSLLTPMEGAGSVAQALTVLLEGMYSGILANKVGGVALNTMWFMYFLIPLPAVGVSALSYYFGVRDLRFTSVFNRQPYPDSDAAPKKKRRDDRDGSSDL